MMRFFLLVNRQGIVRLKKFWAPMDAKQTLRSIREVQKAVLSRSSRVSNFVDWQDYTLVYRRYAALCAVFCVDRTENELLQLEIIHQFIQILDVYFGNVCELDLIFNFPKVYLLLDEFIIAGEMQETSISRVAEAMERADTEESASASVNDGAIGTIMKALSIGADTEADREAAARRAGLQTGASSSSKTEFTVKAPIDGQLKPVTLCVKKDAVQLKNIHTEVVEREWTLAKIKGFDTTDETLTIEVSTTGRYEDTATTKITFETREGAAISSALALGVKRYNMTHK
eukprot:m51a1_g10909 Adaptor protein complex 1 (AP-1), sigma subunit B (287) ;mRNA; f:65306-66766